MRPDADPSPRGIARLVAELLDRLDLHDVTLVGTDTGGAIVQLLMCDGAARVGWVVLASCDAFDNFPPGLTGKTLVMSGKLPPTLFGLFMQQMRLRPLRRLPIAFGWLTMRGDDATARWIRPVLEQPAVRRDTVRVLRAIAAQRNLMVEAAECLRGFDRSALVLWASQDASCRLNTGTSWPSCSRRHGSSRSPTATRSFRWTSPRGSRRPSRRSCTRRSHPRPTVCRETYVVCVRLIVARCEVRYSGRLSAVLPESLRLIMVKSDGSVMVHADHGGYKPSNWMTPPTVIQEEPGCIVVRKHAGTTEDRLDIRIAEVLSDVEHDMGEAAALEKDGVEADLQAALAAAPEWCGEGFRLVRREWPTDIGPVDLMCRDDEDGWVAVEIKRVGTIDAVEQLARYLERIRLDPAMGDCRGVLAAQVVKPQARVLAEARDIVWVEVDLAVLRREREPDLTLFVA
jgi:RecB family endonuclease NucS